MQQKIDLRINNSRPRIGTTRKLSLTLPDDAWEAVDALIQSGKVTNLSGAIRMIIDEWRNKK